MISRASPFKLIGEHSYLKIFVLYLTSDVSVMGSVAFVHMVCQEAQFSLLAAQHLSFSLVQAHFLHLLNLAVQLMGRLALGNELMHLLLCKE